jgi:pimeloyl-ACP methyl ester carboxylesterase
VDLPGEPGRSAPERPSWSNLDFTEWMEDLLAALGIERVALLGISQGAWTALRFATCHPDRVSKLVLLSPGGIVPVRPSFLLRAIALSMAGRRGAEALNRFVMGGQPVPEEAVRFMDAILTHFRARIEPQPLFSDAELLRLTMPVLALLGERDVLFPANQVASRLAKLLANETIVVQPGMGHVLHNVARTVMPFLAPAEALAAEL